MKKATKRKGFTLVELLIVIVVIGILSAMMMLSSTEAVTSAKASNIISNLRNLKTAALAYYVDHLDYLEDSKNSSATISMSDVAKYLNSSPSQSSTSSTAENVTTTTYTADGFVYSITTAKRNDNATTLAEKKWYLKVVVNDTNVQTKLAGRAKSVGLLAETNEGSDTEKANGEYKASGNNATDVYYLVR
ncbi:MAG: type II secretion system protein [Synergistaceae bacterium]|nr:type II secretion system protein [Synergistaceae bacterium]